MIEDHTTPVGEETEHHGDEDSPQEQHERHQHAPPTRPATPIPIPCKFFAMGTCKHGAECRFLHNVSQQWYPNSGDQSGSVGGSRGGRGGYPRPYRPFYGAPHHHQQPYFQGQSAGGWDQSRGGGRGRGGRGGGRGRGGFGGRGGRGGRGRGRGGPVYTPEQIGTRPGPESKRGERVEQPCDYFLVLDLEGKEEIIEFPVALVDAKTLEIVDRFHRYCVPVTFPEDRLKIYITTKYGKWGLADKWFSSAISFVDTIAQFEDWMADHKLLATAESSSEQTFSFAFVTCGNWDIKTQIPRQCRYSGIPVPGYFHQWVNLKDAYLNFYAHRALGMADMLNGLSIKLQGHHHSGADDVENIASILVRMISDGAKIEITASRADENSAITYRYTNRI